MKIVGFIKKRFSGFLNEKPKVEKEKISFKDITKVLDDKKKDIEKREGLASKAVIDELSIFTAELDEKLSLFESVSLDKRKEDIRIKHLVLTNFKLYESDVKGLISSLKNLDGLKFDSLVLKINSVFFDFKKKSTPKYQKATFLIGKELGDVNDRINSFFSKYSSIIKDNEKFLEEKKIIYGIRTRLNSIEENEKEMDEIDSEGKKINLEIKEMKKIVKDSESSIEAIRNSGEYSNNLKNIEREKELENLLSKEMHNLRLMIDFKTLSDIFHSSEKYRHIVRKFKENFTESFREDWGKTLLEILNEAKVCNDDIDRKVRDICEIESEISRLKLKIEKDRVTILEDEIKKINLNILSLDDGRAKALKRLERIKTVISDIKDSIKTDLEKMDISVN